MIPGVAGRFLPHPLFFTNVARLAVCLVGA